MLSECGALFGVRLVLDGLFVGLKHGSGEIQHSLKVSVGAVREVVLRVGHSVVGLLAELPTAKIRRRFPYFQIFFPTCCLSVSWLDDVDVIVVQGEEGLRSFASTPVSAGVQGDLHPWPRGACGGVPHKCVHATHDGRMATLMASGSAHLGVTIRHSGMYDIHRRMNGA